MARAIEQLGSGLTVGYAALGIRGEEPGSVRQQVYDGNPVNARAVGWPGARFLGVDAPEMSARASSSPGGARPSGGSST